MLNELSQVVEAMGRQGITVSPRHRRVTPMGKNKDLLIVGISDTAAPISVEVWPGSDAQYLFRVEHGSAGSSFPGFNLPTPLRCLNDVPLEKLRPAVENLLSLAKNKGSANSEVIGGLLSLFSLSTPRTFTDAQGKSFDRSCGELVRKLREKFSNSPERLNNFCRLLDVVEHGKPGISSFSQDLATLLANGGTDASRKELLLFQNILFGTLDCGAEIGTPGYLAEKEKKDKQANQPVYFDLARPDARFKRVAHQETSSAINDALMISENSAAADTDGRTGIDAYSGAEVSLQDKFPSPKVAELGSLKLYSVNTSEVSALRRYGLEGSQAFPVSAGMAQKMNDALLYLASEEKRGVTCRAVPSAHSGKRDLLVAYLEGEPPPTEQLAEMFGGEVDGFSDADFSAIARPVLGMLGAKAGLMKIPS